MSGHRLLFADLVDNTARVACQGDGGAATRWAEHEHQARRLLAGLAGLGGLRASQGQRVSGW